MADNDVFCYPYHIDDCMPSQQKWPNKGPLHSEMLPRNSRKGAGSTSEKPQAAKEELSQDFHVCFGLVSDTETFSTEQRGCKEKPSQEKVVSHHIFCRLCAASRVK